MTTATVHVTHADGALTIDVAGEIDMVNATTVHQQLLDAVSNQETAVRVDLSGLTFMDSAGLRILFALADRLELLQIQLDVVVPAHSIPRRAMELAGFTPMTVTHQQPG